MVATKNRHQKNTIAQLRQGMAQLPEPEAVQPWITEPARPVAQLPPHPEPPPGRSWDEVWPDEEARQVASGEEPQA